MIVATNFYESGGWVVLFALPALILIILLPIIFGIILIVNSRKEQEPKKKKNKIIIGIIVLLLPFIILGGDKLFYAIGNYKIQHRYDNYKIIKVKSLDETKEKGFTIDNHKVINIYVDSNDIFWKNANINKKDEPYAYLDVENYEYNDKKEPIYKIKNNSKYDIYLVKNDYYIEESFFKNDVYESIFSGPIIKAKSIDEIVFLSTSKESEEEKGFVIDNHKVIQVHFWDGYDYKTNRKYNLIKKYNNSSTTREWNYSKVEKPSKRDLEYKYKVCGIIELEEYDKTIVDNKYKKVPRAINVYKIENDSNYDIYYIDYYTGNFYIDENYFNE